VDQRLATLDMLWDWQPGRIRGPAGPPELAALALPLEMPRAPWMLAAGERRNSRRMDVPPGRYRFEVALRSPASLARVRVELGSGPLVFAGAVLDAAHARVAVPVLLPAGARRAGISAVGLDGEAALASARLVPEALVPRDARGPFAWPEFAEPGRYRLGDVVRATAQDRSAPDGGGFRIAGRGELLVDGPHEAVAVVHVRRERPAPADALEWSGREIRLGPGTQVALHLPLRDGIRLQDDAVVPVRLRAERAWVRITPAAR
jgi:hypothetical protein